MEKQTKVTVIIAAILQPRLSKAGCVHILTLTLAHALDTGPSFGVMKIHRLGCQPLQIWPLQFVNIAELSGPHTLPAAK